MNILLSILLVVFTLILTLFFIPLSIKIVINLDSLSIYLFNFRLYQFDESKLIKFLTKFREKQPPLELNNPLNLDLLHVIKLDSIILKYNEELENIIRYLTFVSIMNFTAPIILKMNHYKIKTFSYQMKIMEERVLKAQIGFHFILIQLFWKLLKIRSAYGKRKKVH